LSCGPENRNPHRTLLPWYKMCELLPPTTILPPPLLPMLPLGAAAPFFCRRRPLLLPPPPLLPPLLLGFPFPCSSHRRWNLSLQPPPLEPSPSPTAADVAYTPPLEPLFSPAAAAATYTVSPYSTFQGDRMPRPLVAPYCLSDALRTP
jgi:hypothetical protein